MMFVLRCLAAAVLYAVADRVMPRPPAMRVEPREKTATMDALQAREVTLKRLRIVDGVLGEMFGWKPPEVRQ